MIITFNSATIEDAPAMHQLVGSCNSLDVNSRYLYLLLCTHFSEYTLTAKTGNGKLVGFVSSYPHPKDHQTLFIWQVGVCQKFRKHGIGSQLVNSVVSSAVKSGINYIEATFTPSNHASMNMFKKIAREMKTGTETLLYFPKELLPPNHEEEWLIRIGPINKGEYTNENI
jgi:L-2,4-diaminobutyric acid acetyltransferase